MNRKGEFLTKLAALMREYETEIEVDYDDGMEMYVQGYQYILIGKYLDADILESKIEKE